MGKVKKVVMGDEKAEEAARKAAAVKREQKKLAKKATEKTTLDQPKEPATSKTSFDLAKSAEILKMLEKDKSTKTDASEKKADVKKPEKKVSESKTATPQQKSPDDNKVTHGKKYNQVAQKLDKNKLYSMVESVGLAKETSYAKFVGTIETHINVLEKGLRGSVVLPHGTGKKLRIVVASEELIDSIAKTGKYDFDMLVAHPSMMAKLAKVAKILGPKGLMPNPKNGTIGENTDELIKKLSGGQINWKTEANFPIIHTVIGKTDFENKKLSENLQALIKSVGKDKIRTLFVKSTMGPAIKVQF